MTDRLESKYLGWRGFQFFKRIYGEETPLIIQPNRIHSWGFDCEVFPSKEKYKGKDLFYMLIETLGEVDGKIWVKLNDSPYCLYGREYMGFDLAPEPKPGFEGDVIGKYYDDVGHNVLTVKYECSSWLPIGKSHKSLKIKSVMGARVFKADR